MIRRIGDIWAQKGEAKEAERQFVEKLLINLANGKPITTDTWRDAQDVWEQTVKDFIDIKHPRPENAAMYALIAATTSGTDVEGAMQRFYATGPE